MILNKAQLNYIALCLKEDIRTLKEERNNLAQAGSLTDLLYGKIGEFAFTFLIEINNAREEESVACLDPDHIISMIATARLFLKEQRQKEDLCLSDETMLLHYEVNKIIGRLSLMQPTVEDITILSLLEEDAGQAELILRKKVSDPKYTN